MKLVIGNPYLEKINNMLACTLNVYFIIKKLFGMSVRERFNNIYVKKVLICCRYCIMVHSSDEDQTKIKIELYLYEQLYYKLNSYYILTVISETDRYFNVKTDCLVV